MAYNATAYKFQNGEHRSTEAVELRDGKVVRACGMWSPLNGTDEYDAAWRHSAELFGVEHIEIVEDGAQGYRQALSGLALPPAYQAAS